ncbi:MAG: GTPase ObgE, partial [Phycisphaerae bacterium]|nr:GTPase ObgE [Phycisphaerae bacterium]
CPISGSDPAEDYRAIRRELASYSPALATKSEIVVANKMDLTGADAQLRAFRKAVPTDVVAISAVTGRGLPQLVRRIWKTLAELGAQDEEPRPPKKPPKRRPAAPQSRR